MGPPVWHSTATAGIYGGEEKRVKMKVMEGKCNELIWRESDHVWAQTVKG